MLVNPVHFFNEVGTSLMTEDYLTRKVEALQAENDDLKDKIRRLTDRLRGEADTENRYLAI